VRAEESPVKPGDTIWVRGGIYKEEVAVQIGGKSDLPLTIKAFPGEKPVIDGEGKRKNGIVLRKTVNADYVTIEGLTVKGVSAEGIGIYVDKRTGVIIRAVEVSGAGMGVTQCEWVLCRRNLIYNNRAQHVTTNIKGSQGNAGAFWYSGGRHHHLGAPPGAQHNAFVHNTLYGNGTEKSSWGGIQHGISGYPRVGENRFLNNLVQNSLGACVVYVGTTPVVLNGNIYHGQEQVKVLEMRTNRLFTPSRSPRN